MFAPSQARGGLTGWKDGQVYMLELLTTATLQYNMCVAITSCPNALT